MDGGWGTDNRQANSTMTPDVAGLQQTDWDR